MAKSLQEQLLNAGLVSTKQVRQANASKAKKQKKDRHQKSPAVDQTRLELEKKAAEKAERDLALNRKREEKRQRREIQAQIKQIVAENRIEEDDDGEAFHFQHKGLVKKVYVSDPVRAQLVDGRLGIVLAGRRYRIVPLEIALKVKGRDESALVLLQDPKARDDAADLDPDYAEYKIPDDLTW